MKINDVTTEYTGGGIYIFMGELDNGIYFMCDDMYINFLNADPRKAGEAVYYIEWQEEHEADFEVNFPNFFIYMCEWIEANKPYDYDASIERMKTEMKKEWHTTQIETGYVPEMDMTVIVKYEYDEEGDPYSKEIIGWYQGKPNDKDTETYKDMGCKAILNREICLGLGRCSAD